MGKLTNIGTFAVGVIVTAVSLGAATYVNAAGDTTITACGNKTSGAMRYISKGSCRKTETVIKWNQVGPQGLPGAPGANGKALEVVDTTGKSLGYVLGDGQAGALTPEFLVLKDDRLWRVSSDEYGVQGSGYSPNAYSNSTCTSPLGLVVLGTTPSAQLTFGSINQTDGGSMYTATSKYVDGLDLTKPVYRSLSPSTCTLLTSTERSDEFTNRAFFNLIPITAPTYVAPLSVVLK